MSTVRCSASQPPSKRKRRGPSIWTVASSVPHGAAPGSAPRSADPNSSASAKPAQASRSVRLPGLGREQRHATRPGPGGHRQRLRPRRRRGPGRLERRGRAHPRRDEHGGRARDARGGAGRAGRSASGGWLAEAVGPPAPRPGPQRVRDGGQGEAHPRSEDRGFRRPATWRPGLRTPRPPCPTRFRRPSWS